MVLFAIRATLRGPHGRINMLKWKWPWKKRLNGFFCK